MSEKSFDIILIGATGFTGKRAAKYLKEHAPASLKWGIAARNPEKLNRIADELDLSDENLFIVDVLNRKQVDKVVQQTYIIITTVGPFSLYGENIIASCAENGTHYLDITGEVGFIKQMKNKYQQTAIQNEAKIIPFSGFDSVPAEITAYLLSKAFDMPDQLHIESYYSIKGGFNGGTIATMLNKFETGEYKKMKDPQLLMSSRNQIIAKNKNSQHFGYNNIIQRWTAPFIMGPINSKVVYNTASEMRLLAKPYADELSYQEFSSLGKWYNPIPFLLTSLILIAITTLGPKKWFRKLLKKLMPSPGEGPSEEAIENGYFKLRAFATTSTGETKNLSIFYPGDPGNKSTVFFLCESALCLSLQKEKTSLKNNRFGFLSPILAFEEALINHLEKKGLEIVKP